MPSITLTIGRSTGLPPKRPGAAKIPADAAGGGQAVPFGGHIPRLFAIADHKTRVVTAVAHRSFEIERKRLAQGRPAAKLGNGRLCLSLLPEPMLRSLAVTSGTTV